MLKFNQINKAFGKRAVIKDLNYSFDANKIYALMGANGSGKTTLFNLIGGFLKIDSGTITFKNQDISQRSPYRIAQAGIARTFQNLRIMPSLSVTDNIYLAFKNKPDEKITQAFLRNSSYHGYKEKIDAIVTETHLNEVKNTLAGNISYGQQKLLTLAIAMANDFDLLLLDEPVAGVQIEYRKQISKLLRAMHKTIILIEHNAEFIENLTDHVLFLNKGHIIAEGNYQQIKDNPEVQEAYL